jgi:hypothetical protein
LGEGLVLQNNMGAWADGVSPQYRMNRRAEQVISDFVIQAAMDGRVFVANHGVGTAPATFNAAYVATTPDFQLYVPLGTTVIPVAIEVNFEVVGTEALMEIVAMATNTCDNTGLTATALTVKPIRVDGPVTSACTAVGTVTGGCTTPYTGTYYEFWRATRPLTDTVATGENDRHDLRFCWALPQFGAPPIIVGSTLGSGLDVYACSQAGQGYIV